MTTKSEIDRELQIEKIKTIQKITELNALHIKTQSQLSGIEIDTARCEEAIEEDKNSSDIADEKLRLGQQYSEVMQARVLIDEQRDALERKLQELDMKLENSFETAE